MRVKKLEIFGFKSFASKTTIHFEPGVTAIVGPNGSGKSNIVDAIRWVLGEHNPRDVRAPRLEDVIFNGTDQRAPLSMAEVHLTIDNAQGLLPISFTEVTMTRRVYRSGESECLINQSPCRLKDIQELLLGTGLGGGTYAIIEQGHIDMVLSSKPEERRIVFEEASGVAKYLAKKQETIRRLDEVEEHLVRIADITAEVRRQVSALERAANKARQYKTQWEQLKSFELRLAIDELGAGCARYGELEQQLQRLHTQQQQLEQQKQQTMSSLEACNAAVSAVQQHLQALRTTIIECASHMEQHATQSVLKTRWIEELGQQILQLEREQQQLRERQSQVEEQLARSSGADAELQGQLAGLTEQLAQHRSGLTVLEQTAQALINEVATAKTQLFGAASEASQLRNEQAALTIRLQGLDGQLTRLDQQRADRIAQVQTTQQRRDGLQQEHDALKTHVEELDQRRASTAQAVEAAGARRHELGGRLDHVREQLAHQRAQVTLLEDLWRRYEGFPDTVKTLMEQSIDGLMGPLVDVIQAVPGYEAVIEAALGPLADALVVRDRAALGRCRELLRTASLEGCRFLVLEDCPAKVAVGEPHRVQAGVSGAVRQYIHTEPAYRGLVDWLLNDSWLVDDIQRLLDERSIPQGRVVSLRGDRWDRRSWRFNGAHASSHGRVGRKQRWEAAQEALRVLEQEFAQLETQAQQAEQNWQTCISQQEAIKNEAQQLSVRFHRLEAQLAQSIHEAQRVAQEEQTLDVELQQLRSQREELITQLTQTQQAVEVAQHRQQTTEQVLADAQTRRESSEQHRHECLIAITQLEASKEALAQRASALGARQQELDTDRTSLLQQLDEKTRQHHDAAARTQELTQQLEEHHRQREQLQGEHQTAEGQAAAIAQTLREHEGQRDQVLPQLLHVEQQLSALGRQIQDQTQQLSERTFRRSRLIERLRELYQIDETTVEAEQRAAPAPLSDEQRATMTEQVQKLRAKLEGMGPVSLGSVEEYDELKRRLEFLQTQQQDLVQARDDLKASITQINRAARAQFRETFERIKQEFQHYYGRLFDGGHADLILMDEEDVLECGIDIVARPPGKRLQNISLLSGGERALTAIALLFALFKVRPSPFCILDEIDAPLDEANVDRFTRVLEEFLELSQFILITHNKKTITKADVLYGVTMEEAGISKILSAKLSKTPTVSPPPASLVTTA